MVSDPDAIVAMSGKLLAERSSVVEEEFARAIMPTVKAMVTKQAWRYPADMDDLVQEAIWTVILTLRDGKLRDPDNVFGYIQGVVINMLRLGYRRQRHLCDLNAAFGMSHPDPSPEAAIIRKRMAELEFDVLQSVLDSIPALNLEVMVRFYVYEQSKEAICGELKITETQFRLAKSRTKLLVTKLLSERLGTSFQTKPHSNVSTGIAQ